MEFAVGDQVFAPRIGIGRIRSRETISAAGMDVEVFVMIPDFPVDPLSIPIQHIPVRRAHKALLQPATKEELFKALSILSQPSVQTGKMWAKKSEAYTEALKTGDVLEIAAVYRDARKNDMSEEFLSFGERKFKFEALTTLAIHIMQVAKMTLADAKELVSNIGSKSVSLETAQEILKIESVDLKTVKSRSLPVEKRSMRTKAEVKAPTGGKRSTVIDMPIDESKLNPSITDVRVKLDMAREAFAGFPNKLVLYAVDHLYKPEDREAGLKEYIKLRNLAQASLAPARSEVKKIFNRYAEKRQSENNASADLPRAQQNKTSSLTLHAALK